LTFKTLKIKIVFGTLEEKMNFARKVIYKYYFCIITIIISTSISSGYFLHSKEGIIYNILFLGGFFYIGKNFDQEGSKLLFLGLTIATSMIIIYLENIGIKTYLFPFGIFLGIILAFLGIIFFSKKTIKSR
jgi:hypothetical protein